MFPEVAIGNGTGLYVVYSSIYYMYYLSLTRFMSTSVIPFFALFMICNVCGIVLVFCIVCILCNFGQSARISEMESWQFKILPLPNGF